LRLQDLGIRAWSSGLDLHGVALDSNRRDGDFAHARVNVQHAAAGNKGEARVRVADQDGVQKCRRRALALTRGPHGARARG